MEIKRINVTILEVENNFFWFKDPDDFDPSCLLDINNIEEMILEVPNLDGRLTTVQLHGPFASRVESEKDMMLQYDLATWGTVH